MATTRFARIVAYALSRPEAYLVTLLVFVAVVVAILGRWPAWIIPASIAAGALLLALVVADSVADPEAQQDAAIAEVEPGKIHDQALRTEVLRALEYVRAARKLTRHDGQGTLDAAGDEIPPMEQAARSIHQMCLRLQEFRADRLIARDLNDLRQASRLGRLTPEQDEQLGALRQLDGVVQNAEREIQDAVANLGRAYAEMQRIRVTPGLRGQAADVLGQLEASTTRLSDLAAGYDEAFGSHKSRG